MAKAMRQPAHGAVAGWCLCQEAAPPGENFSGFEPTSGDERPFCIRELPCLHRSPLHSQPRPEQRIRGNGTHFVVLRFDWLGYRQGGDRSAFLEPEVERAF